MAAIATSGESDLLRGTPCWSTTISRTVRRSTSRIRAAPSSAAAACSPLYRPCRAMNPCWPTPLIPCGGVVVPTVSLRSGAGRGSALLDHVLEQRGGEVVWLDVGERQERLGALHAGDLEDLGEQQLAQMRVVADAQTDEQVEAAGDDAHGLGLRQLPDLADDLAQVHPGAGGHREVHHDGQAERRPVNVRSVAAEHPAALEPGEPVSHRWRRHLDVPGEGSLRLPGVGGQRAQQRQVEVVYLHLGPGRRGYLRQLGQRRWVDCHLEGCLSSDRTV